MKNDRRRILFNAGSILMALTLGNSSPYSFATAFLPVTGKVRNQGRNDYFHKSNVNRILSRKASFTEENEVTTTTSKILTTSDNIHNDLNSTQVATSIDSHDEGKENWILENLREKIGKVDENRMVMPEFANGEVDRLFR